MGLPLASHSNAEVSLGTNFDQIDNKDSKDNQMFEIDLKYVKSIAKKLKIPPSKIDCYPLLWFRLAPKKKEEWEVELKQKVAFKYSVIKLIGHSGN